MRTIKFRAWVDKPLCVFVYFCLNDLESGYIRDWSGRPHLLALLEVEQFTGLHDKHGTEIYEGDIVDSIYDNTRVTIEGYHVVEMGYGSDSDGYSHGWWYGWKAGYSSLLDVHELCTVVGNVHENPELLQ